MSSVILPSAVAALAHRRLAEIEDALRRKVEALRISAGTDPPTTRPVVVNEVERRMLALAVSARDAYRGGRPIEQGYGHGILPGVSREALAGAIAWEWPLYAQRVVRPEAWMATAMRRGSPDPAYGHVVVPTTDFALHLGARVVAGAAGTEAGRARAFAMGLLSGVASGVVLSPIQRGVHDQATRRRWTRHQPASALRSAEQLALRSLVGGPNPGDRWLAWLPGIGETPDRWFDDYVAVAEQVYGFGGMDAATLAPFLERFDPAAPLRGGELRIGYDLVRLDAALAGWGAGAWYLTLLPALLAPSLALLTARFLPNSSRYFTTGTPGERGRFELLMSGMGFGALAPVIWTSMLWSQLGALTSRFLEITIVNALQLIAVGLGLGSAATDWGAEVRWGPIFAGAQAIDVYKLVRGIIAAVAGRRFVAFAFFLNTYPTLNGWLSVLIGELFDAAGVEDDGVFAGLLIALTGVILLGAGLPLAFALEGGGPLRLILDETATISPRRALASRAAGVANTVASVFDDSTLWRQPGSSDPPALDQFRYPSQGRALVRLWWEGAGELHISHDAQRVIFRIDDGPEVPVTLLPTDFTAAAVANRLTGAVGGDNELKVEVVHEPYASARIAHPATLADPGDDAATLGEHEALRTEFAPVGTSSDDGYVLRHGPQGELTTGYGMRGPSGSDLSGFTLAPVTGTADLPSSGVGLAAELAAMLSLGAAPTLASPRPRVGAVDGRPAVANPELGEVHQIFRRWNLDERRANEWRMLVTGGARSEKGDPITSADPAMRPVSAGYAVAAPEGEPIANALGWIPAFRAWLRVAADLAADTDAADAERYSPEISLPGGAAANPITTLRRPTNRELSAAVRFLFDLP